MEDSVKIFVDKCPNREITQAVLFFQFQHMGWVPGDIDEEVDRYGALSFGYVLAYKGNELVGMTNLHKREIEWNGETVTVGGLGGVCVHRNFRKHGIGTKVVAKAMEVLREVGCDVGFLNSDLDKRKVFYGQHGFRVLNRDYVTTGLSGKKYVDKNGMIAPLNSLELFEKLLSDTSVLDLQGPDW